ncbi:MAG: histidine phosphatase family protein [Elusimicrobiota bacterium]|jgi:broad specificity phosphatase PhoE
MAQLWAVLFFPLAPAFCQINTANIAPLQSALIPSPGIASILDAPLTTTISDINSARNNLLLLPSAIASPVELSLDESDPQLPASSFLGQGLSDTKQPTLTKKKARSSAGHAASRRPITATQEQEQLLFDSARSERFRLPIDFCHGLLGALKSVGDGLQDSLSSLEEQEDRLRSLFIGNASRGSQPELEEYAEEALVRRALMTGYQRAKNQAPSASPDLALLQRELSKSIATASQESGSDMAALSFADEGDGLLINMQGSGPTPKDFKLFYLDGGVHRRMNIPEELKEIYGALPGGGIKILKEDPVATALRGAGNEIWALRHGQSEFERKDLVAGNGSDPALTETPDAQGNSGLLQARAAARELYTALGADAWALQVLSGRTQKLVVLSSPKTRTLQTTKEFTALLDERARSLDAEGSGLYELVITPELGEMRYGFLDGMPVPEWWKSGFVLAWDSWKGTGRDSLDRFLGFDPLGEQGESRFDVVLRQRKLFQEILKRWPSRKIVCFSHAQTLASQRILFNLAQRSPVDGAIRIIPTPNAKPIPLVTP